VLEVEEALTGHVRVTTPQERLDVVVRMQVVRTQGFKVSELERFERVLARSHSPMRAATAQSLAWSATSLLE
jgi:hypothetical protein